MQSIQCSCCQYTQCLSTVNHCQPTLTVIYCALASPLYDSASIGVDGFNKWQQVIVIFLLTYYSRMRLTFSFRNNLIRPQFHLQRFNGEGHYHFLANVLPGFMEEMSFTTRQRILFLHDGAPIHFARIYQCRFVGASISSPQFLRFLSVELFEILGLLSR